MASTSPYTVAGTDTFQTFVTRYNEAVSAVPLNSATIGLDMTGNTDMSSILQSTLNNMSSNGGGVLQLGPGTIKIASTVTVPANIWIQGLNTNISGIVAPVFTFSGNGSQAQGLNVTTTTTNGYAVSVTGNSVILMNLNITATEALEFTGNSSNCMMLNSVVTGLFFCDQMTQSITATATEFTVNGSATSLGSVAGMGITLFGCYLNGGSLTFTSTSQMCSVVSHMMGASIVDQSMGMNPQLQLVGTTSLGAKNGVATLDSNTKVPMAQLYAGTASGLATLDTTGNVPASQLGNVPKVNNATNSAVGLVEVSANPSSGNPIAVSVSDTKWTTLTGGTSTDASGQHTHNTFPNAVTFNSTTTTKGAATFQSSVSVTGTLTASSQTAPLNMPNLSATPATVGPAGTICVVNSMWYVSNGTSWVQMSAPPPPNASTGTVGLVEVSAAPSGTPVAVSVTDTKWTTLTGGTATDASGQHTHNTFPNAVAFTGASMKILNSAVSSATAFWIDQPTATTIRISNGASAGSAGAITIGTNGSIITPNNTLDDGSGNASVKGKLTVAGRFVLPVGTNLY